MRPEEKPVKLRPEDVPGEMAMSDDLWRRVDEAIDTDPLKLRDIVAEVLSRAQRAEDEVARLRGGEDTTPREPGVQLTPGQWIHRWNQLTGQQRLTKVAGLFEMVDIGHRCAVVEDHDGWRWELEGAQQHIRGLLDGSETARLGEQVSRVRDLASDLALLADKELDVDAAVRDPEVLIRWAKAECGRALLEALGGG